MKLTKVKWLPIGILAGVGILIFNNNIMKKDVPLQLKEPEHHVYITQIKSQKIAPQVKGYGNIVAKNTWQAIAEVNGSITYKNPRLQRGTFLDEGVELLRIDPASYQLALDKAEANLASSQAEHEKLVVEQDRLKLSLTVEQKNLDLEQKEFNRLQSLQDKGTISLSALEKQQRIYYTKQLQVNDIQAQINQLPARFNALLAQQNQARSQLSQAQLDLQHTIITMPFSGRIIDVNAELKQFVSTGASLVLAHDVAKLEVEAKMSPPQLGRLIQSIKRASTDFTNPTKIPDIATANLPATITLRSSTGEHHWQGRVTRILGEINPRLGTAGLVIETDFDFLEFIKRNDPSESPLISGMFVEVAVDGYPQQQLTVPLDALHNDRIYLVDENNRLVVKPVQVLFVRDQQAAIKAADLEAGQNIVLSDITPVANGLKLAPTQWTEANQQ